MKVWDYKIPKNWKPKDKEGWIWYLERKINYGDFKGLNPRIVKKYFGKLRLDDGKRLMFENYLRRYGEEKKVADRWEFFLHNHREVRFEFVHFGNISAEFLRQRLG